ncbi:MAG: cytochrome c maturation protein CcmE [Anaerolineae bacterium]|jgi:cytochrome c-type biogenesis protein CcmE
MRGKTKFIIAGSLVVAAVAYLIATSTGTTAHYFLTIEELRAMRQDTHGRRVTISGAVLGDSIEYDPSEPRVTFTIVQVPGDPKEVERAGGLAKVLRDAVTDPDAPRLEVVYDDVKPDLLQHESQAIVRGQLQDDGRFHAAEVLLKCPTRYEEGVPGQAEGS